MKQFLTLLFIITAISVFGQQTKKVKNKIDKNTWEEYTVLKSNENIKHGSYQKYSFKNLKIAGYYKNGKKDSLWTEYLGYGKIKNQGYYKDDKRIGVWEFYNTRSQLISKYDYDTKDLIFHKEKKKLQDVEKTIVKTSNGLEEHQLEQSPVYLGGENEILEILRENIIYPRLAIESGKSGTVLISFFVTAEGKAIDHAIEQGFDSACDEEALRVVKLIPDNWSPGIIDGEAVTAKYIRSVRYVLK